ncbi:DUF4136 domain-containing protein [uncultured Tenacibaculum sp.]|uniref:DUF4136 domain-containing protein n=1 Tax=uncultured Tenacibaculum sp. TaxID=174713 RepID=UPI0026025FAD|nr:DUF4136 domain-containing protein [uncultured Tenacibaculum sp.]
MKYFKLLGILLLVGCASVNVVSDYDSKTNFKQYATFLFYEDAGKGLNELDVKRIEREIVSGLESKGMRVNEAPTMYVNIVSEERVSENRNTIGVGIGGGRNVGFGISGGIPIGGRKIQQQLVIDFVDAKTNELIWQGIANTEVKERTSPEEREQHYKKVIHKILEQYPPKKPQN